MLFGSSCQVVHIYAGEVGQTASHILSLARPLRAFGEAGLKDRTNDPSRVWNGMAVAARYKMQRRAPFPGRWKHARGAAVTTLAIGGYLVN